MGARKLRLKNRENPKIVFSARVSSLPLSVKHWFFFFIYRLFSIYGRACYNDELIP